MYAALALGVKPLSTAAGAAAVTEIVRWLVLREEVSHWGLRRGELRGQQHRRGKTGVTESVAGVALASCEAPMTDRLPV